VKKIFHRKNAIFPATVVGRPPQEDHAITCYLQDLFRPVIKLLMPDVVDVWAYSEAGVHTLTGAVVKNRYAREALTAALKIISQGQLALTKMLLATDRPCDTRNIKELLPVVLERTRVSSDLFVLSPSSQDTLDETGPQLNEGSKIIWLGVGEKKRELPKEWGGQTTDSQIKNIKAFCPGVLVCDGPCFDSNKAFAQTVAADPAFKVWPLIFLVDDAQFSTASTENFLWSTFTRFEPAADVYAAQSTIDRNHVSRTPPIVIDCRTKPWYPEGVS
jgi:3-polyprenyl-4-hydroxybenzoate decarboxylase